MQLDTAAARGLLTQQPGALARVLCRLARLSLLGGGLGGPEVPDPVAPDGLEQGLDGGELASGGIRRLLGAGEIGIPRRQVVAPPRLTRPARTTSDPVGPRAINVSWRPSPEASPRRKVS